MRPLQTNNGVPARKPVPVRDQTQGTPPGVQGQQGNGSSSRTAQPTAPASTGYVANLRAQAGTTGGPTAAQVDAKSPYLYKKEMDDAKKANAAERKEAKTTADGLHKEMQSLGRDISKLESKVKSEEGRKVPNGLKLAELNTHLDAKRNELGEKTNQYREVSRRLTHLEGQNAAISTELGNIKDMSKRTFQSPLAKGEQWYAPKFQSPVTRSPESQAYRAEKKTMHGMSADDRAIYTQGKANPKIGENMHRDYLEAADRATQSPMPGNSAPRVPATFTDASFDAVVGAKGFIKPELIPPKAEKAASTHSAETPSPDAMPVYHYKQALKAAQPRVSKQIEAEQTQQETLRGQINTLNKDIGLKEQEIRKATASTMGAGSSRAGASLPQLHADLEGLQGQLHAKKTEMSESMSRLDDLQVASRSMETDLKNVRKDTNLHFQSPVTVGESWRSPLHFQNPIQHGSGRDQYMQDKADFKAMSPVDQLNHRNDISDRELPRVGLNHNRDISESRETGRPMPDRRTDEQKAKDQAADQKWWSDLKPEKQAMFTSPRRDPAADPSQSHGPKHFADILGERPVVGGSSLQSPIAPVPNPRDSLAQAAPQRNTAPQQGPTMSGALNPPPMGQGRLPRIDEE